MKLTWTWKGAAEPSPPPAAPPDPALEAAQTLVRTGKVVVRAGNIEYVLARPDMGADGAVAGRTITVSWRLAGEKHWRILNIGWGFGPAFYSTSSVYEFIKDGKFDDGYVETAALTVLQPIFSGLPVWKLRCGAQMDRNFYPE